ncbi:MAG: hypothetical protein MI784_17675, partial [Cytophagales bacterium]|nr:hypothetical protein [Cytophagales bacterium]
MAEIEIDCPYHTSCKEKILIGDITDHEKYLKQTIKPHPWSTLSEETQSQLGLMYFLEEEKRDLYKGTTEIVADNLPDTHLARCPYRPVLCRSCKEAVPENIYLTEHIKSGNCPKARTCDMCQSGFLEGESILHLSSCLPTTIDRITENSESHLPEMKKVLTSASLCIQAQRGLALNLSSSLVSCLIDEAELKQRITQTQRQEEVAQTLRSRIQELQKKNLDHVKEIQGLKIRLQRLEQDSAINTYNSARKSLQKKLKSATGKETLTKVPATQKIWVNTLENMTATECTTHANGISYLCTPDKHDEVILHIKNPHNLPKKAEDGMITWSKLGSFRTNTYTWLNQGVIQLDLSWKRSAAAPVITSEELAPNATIQVDAISAYAENCFTMVTESTPGQTENQIHPGFHLSRRITLAEVPVGKTTAGSDMPQDIIIRLTIRQPS